jgi:TorA maturation chaperone TorD
VSPYETEYGQEALFQQPQEMGDLGGFLKAFGLTLRAEAHERIDHVSCECEFLAFLARKEAYALTQGDDAMAGETRRAGRLFLRDHFGRFGPAFARKLTREDRDGFYGALGELCLAILAAECGRLRVPAGSEFLQLRDVDLDDAPMACGTGQELLNIEGATD